MNPTQEFYDKYQIDSFYESQAKWSPNPIKPFKKEVHKKMSHGKIPGFRNYDLFYERYQSAVEILNANGDLKDGMKVLDLGSGEGFFKFFFDSDYDGKVDWHGIEVWKERADFCRHLGYKVDEINLENGRLPYEDESFDLVLASHVIEHIPNPSQIVKEMGRVLKKDGVLLVATPTKPPVIAELDSYLHNKSNRSTGDTQQAFTHRKVEKLVLDSLGLKKDAVIDKRGFRIISGRKKLPIEDWKWFYKASTYISRKWLLLVPEINLIVKK